jgi:ferredoxin
VARLIIEGYGEHEVEPGTRLVRAIQAAGVDILHRCGGFARCTTCRVEFLAGEPERMTVAEHDKLLENDLLGTCRLSCQCLVADGMSLRPLLRLATSGLEDAGPEPEEVITPEPEWRDRPADLPPPA